MVSSGPRIALPPNHQLPLIGTSFTSLPETPQEFRRFGGFRAKVLQAEVLTATNLLLRWLIVCLANGGGRMNDSELVTLIESARPLARRLAARLRVDADDLLNETYLQLLKDNSSVTLHSRGASDSEAWVCGIVRNVAKQFVRADVRRRRREHHVIQNGPSRPEVESDSPVSLVVQAEERVRIRTALSKLPSRERRALELCLLKGLPHSRTGLQLGLSKSGAWKLVQSGTTRLRTLLGRSNRGKLWH